MALKRRDEEPKHDRVGQPLEAIGFPSKSSGSSEAITYVCSNLQYTPL